MKKSVINLIVIFICASVILMGYLYVKTSAVDDFNDYICGVATELGLPKGMHPHMSDWDGNKYQCK